MILQVKAFQKANLPAWPKTNPLKSDRTRICRDILTEKVIQPKIEKAFTLSESIFQSASIHAALQIFPRISKISVLDQPEIFRKADVWQGGILRNSNGSNGFALDDIDYDYLVAFPDWGRSSHLPGRIRRPMAKSTPSSRQISITWQGCLPSFMAFSDWRSLCVGWLQFTSGAVFGVAAENSRTLLSAGFTMALLVLPLIIISTQEALRTVPLSLKQASYGLGGNSMADDLASCISICDARNPNRYNIGNLPCDRVRLHP